jgi:hypothetical protein
MWRTPVVIIALALVAWLEFNYFPGHSYLASSSQIYVAALEHLDTPGFLSRDLVAGHPNLALTVYDEFTLLLHRSCHISLAQVLLVQHFLARLAGLFGLFLVCRSAGLGHFSSAGLAAVINVGTYLPGPELWLFDPEPVPRAFAFGLVLLALGFLARGKPLLGGFSAGCALLFDPLIAAPFWLTLIVAAICDRKLRRVLRSLAAVFLVFTLLLANLAQLQQGTPDAQDLLRRFSLQIAAIDRFRTPERWLTLWPSAFVYLYLAAFVIGVWALTRIWPFLNRQTRWLVTLLSFFGVLALPASAFLLDANRLPLLLKLAPLELLAFTFLLAWLFWAIAAAHAWRTKRIREALIWSLLVAAGFLLAFGHSIRQPIFPNTAKLAAWADNNTWGSSLFFFADAQRSAYPGRFRADSRRAVWVDWEGGRHLNQDLSIASEWWRRWHAAVDTTLSGQWLQRMLDEPIDYFVFDPKLALEANTGGQRRILKPVFRDNHFAVYEASMLRTVPGELTVNGR